jgi:hypothetical protein
LPADARERAPGVEVLQREGACPFRREAETLPTHVKWPVSTQMLRLLSYEWFGDPEEVVAENRHLTQAFSSSNGVRHLIQDFRRWNLQACSPQPF